MSVWRPSPSIRVKAIGTHWRDGKLLCAEVPDDQGNIKGVRPLGGSIEFGEPWQVALRREFQEELDVEIEVTGPPTVIENIFHHHGHTGHEVIFVAPIQMPKDAFADTDVIHFTEDNGFECTARWFDISTLDTGGLELYPTGLKAHLTNLATA